MNTVYVIGTCDTKGAELSFVKSAIRARGVEAVLVDVSTQGAAGDADINPEDVAGHHPLGASILGSGDRGQAITQMSEALVRFLQSRDDVAGAIGLGGSGGTALIAPALRALPLGTPKVLVSTVASGNVAPYVGASDISMVYSITDIAGLNRISRTILLNAANSIAGMAGRTPIEEAADKPAIGLTMFGVTTPCVQNITRALSDEFDCLVFHATGTGGQSFENLVESGLLKAGIDVTTTEVCDLLCGGVFPATKDRFGAFIRTGAPYVGSCGALDMVNFGARDTVPERYRDRNLYVHNPQITLMRTTPDECTRIGRWIGERLNRCEGEVRFLIPEQGVSAIDAPGKPFHDPAADAALFEALEKTVQQTEKRRLLCLPLHINDPAFADEAVKNFREIGGWKGQER